MKEKNKLGKKISLRAPGALGAASGFSESVTQCPIKDQHPQERSRDTHGSQKVQILAMLISQCYPAVGTSRGASLSIRGERPDSLTCMLGPPPAHWVASSIRQLKLVHRTSAVGTKPEH